MAMKEQGRKGKSKREIAREKQRKAEQFQQEAAIERRKKKRKKPAHGLCVTKRQIKKANHERTRSQSGNKSENCKRHPLKDLLCHSRGFLDPDYEEACFRVDGSKRMKTTSQWIKHKEADS